MKLALSKKFVLLSLLSLTIPCTLYPVPSIKAQEIPSETKKNVVKNFKANLSEYSAFGSNCDQKSKGDANCDGNINEFDLSIWQVEFNTSSNPKRSDFNNDGVINLLDYGVWRNTFYPTLKTTQARESKFLSTLLLKGERVINLISKQSPITQLGFITLGHLLDQLGQLEIRNYFSVYAQETASGGSEINSSSSFTTSSGTSMVVNSLDDGNTQQLNFDQFGNPQTAGFYDGNGQSYANVSFLNSGSTIISTQESGLPISITQTSAGPVIENFRNQDGSLLAIKSWPTRASYDRNEPPLSVTLPGQGSTREILNMQPNGDAIIEKADADGNTLNRTQLRSNGTTVTQDFQNKTIVQANSEIGFTTLSMKNNLGGDTQYMFYKGELYAVVQTKDTTTSYISKPLDESGNTWSFQTVNGGNITEKTVTDPITEVNGGTVDPKTLIQYINYYKQAASDSTAVNFSDGFTSTAPGIKNPVDKANAILKISQAQLPSDVLGLSIVKEAFAQANSDGWSYNPSKSDPSIGEAKFDGPGGAEAVVSVRGAGGDGTANIGVDIYSAGKVESYTFSGDRTNFEGLGFNPGASGTSQVGSVSNPNLGGVFDAARSGSLGVTNNETGATGAQAIGATAPTSQAAQPAAPAAAPAQPATPAGPATGGTSLNHQTGTTISESARSAAAQASDAKDAAGGTPAQNAAAAYAAARSAGADPNQASVLFADSYMVSAIRDAKNDPAWDPTGLNLVTEAAKAGLNPSTVVGSALTTLNGLREADRAAAVTSPTAIQSFTGTPGNTAQGAGSAAGAAAAVAAGIAPPASGFIGTTGVYSQVSASTNPNHPPGTFISDIKSGGPEGQTIATQTHNPGNGYSSWSDSRGTTTTEGGVVTGYTPNNNPFAPGTTYATTADGSIVAVGLGTALDANGHVAGGRSISGAELSFARSELSRQAEETGNTTGVTQANFGLANSTCFLAGTLISTPFGPKAIETLSPLDKVYSYNEKTGQKQISNFKKLDINFVDEYLIINNQIKTTIYHPFYTVQTLSLRGAERRGNLDKNNQDRDANARDDRLITIRADELKLGDILQNENGKYIPVYSIEKVSAPGTTVYNLMSVSPNNNFFAQGILVHNYGADVTNDGSEDPGAGGNPYNPDGSYTDSWAETGGWNPDMFSASDISPGELGGTMGGGDYSPEEAGGGKAAFNGTNGGDGQGWSDGSGNNSVDSSAEASSSNVDSSDDSGNSGGGNDSGSSDVSNDQSSDNSGNSQQ